MGVIRASSGVTVIAQGAGTSHTGDTNEATLASATIPGGTLGANGRIVVEALCSHTSNTNAKTVKIKLGSTQFGGQAVSSSSSSSRWGATVHNNGATNSQVFLTPLLLGPYSAGTGAVVQTGAIDTTQDQVVSITGTLGNAADTIKVEAFHVTVYPHN